VEHPARLRIAGRGLAVVALIEVIAGLLPLGEIDAELQPVLRDEDGARRRRPAHEPVGQLQSLQLGEPALRAPEEDALGPLQLLEHIAHRVEPLGHRQRRHLDGEKIPVAIDDQPGEVVAFAVDEPGGAGAVVEPQRPPEPHGRLQPAPPERRVELHARIEGV
ncbi:MAG: hypothetical protein ACK559_15790, partial [bacterium]